MIDVNLIGAPAFAVRIVGDGFVYDGVNARLCDLTGLDAAKLIGRRPQDCLPPEIAAGVAARYRACVASGQASESEVCHEGPGSARWWQVTLTPVFGTTGGIEALVGVSTDVSARRNAERKQREAEALAALAMDVLDGGFWDLDLATGEVETSPKLARKMAGVETDRMTWAAFTARIHRDDRCLFDAVRDGLEDASGAIEYRVCDETGSLRWLRSKSRPMRDADGGLVRVIGVVTDVTELKHVEARYAHEAMTDPLTGLMNRRGFGESARRFAAAAAANASRFGLVVVDLDTFKPVNDRHGHAIGDDLLRGIAARLAAEVRPEDVVARIGGDEFAILVAEVGDGDLPALAERLLAAARRPIVTGAGDMTVGVSVGLATSREGEDDIEALTARADAALYAAKSAGRGAWSVAA